MNGSRVWRDFVVPLLVLAIVLVVVLAALNALDACDPQLGDACGHEEDQP